MTVASLNPCTLKNFLMIMKENAGKDELYSLRQLSTQYHEAFNSTYFDLAEKCAVIDIFGDIGDIIGEPRNYLSKVSKEFPHIYRHLHIKNLDFLGPKAGKAGQEVMEFLRLVAPNIKDVDITNEGTPATPYFLPMLQELLNSFKNMTKLKLNYNDMNDDIIGTRNVLVQFPLETQIEIHQLGSYIPDEELIKLSEQLSCLNNVSFHGITLMFMMGVNLEQLFTTTSKWFRESSFRKVFLWDDELIIRNNRNVTNMIHWLDRVLGLYKCTQFAWGRRLDDHYDFYLSTIPNESCWKQNIKELNLISYSEPLLCLRDFPNLEKLQLTRINVDRCLLSNVTISDEDNLRAVFEGLSNLEVNICCAELIKDYRSKLTALEPCLQQLVRSFKFM